MLGKMSLPQTRHQKNKRCPKSQGNQPQSMSFFIIPPAKPGKKNLLCVLLMYMLPVPIRG